MKPDMSTDELNHQIKNATDLDDYLFRNRKHMLSGSLHEHLETLLAEKKIAKPDVIKGSLLDRSYVYQIFSGERRPSRDKLIALAFGMGLNVEETQKMLKLSGNRELYARDARDARDAAILFALQHSRTIDEANDLLQSHKLGALGAPL